MEREEGRITSGDFCLRGKKVENHSVHSALLSPFQFLWQRREKKRTRNTWLKGPKVAETHKTGTACGQSLLPCKCQQLLPPDPRGPWQAGR